MGYGGRVRRLAVLAAVRALIGRRRSAGRAPVGTMAAADELAVGADAGLGRHQPIAGLDMIDLTAARSGASAGVADDVRAIAAPSSGGSGSPGSSSRTGAAAGGAAARPAPPASGRRRDRDRGRGRGRGLPGADEGPVPQNRLDGAGKEDDGAFVAAPTWPTGWTDPPPGPTAPTRTITVDDPVEAAAAGPAGRTDPPPPATRQGRGGPGEDPPEDPPEASPTGDGQGLPQAAGDGEHDEGRRTGDDRAPDEREPGAGNERGRSGRDAPGDESWGDVPPPPVPRPVPAGRPAAAGRTLHMPSPARGTMRGDATCEEL